MEYKYRIGTLEDIGKLQKLGLNSYEKLVFCKVI
jgi:hypothetical protein